MRSGTYRLAKERPLIRGSEGMTYNYEDNNLDSRIIKIMRFLDRHLVPLDRNELEAYIRAYSCPKEAYKTCDGVREHSKCRACWNGDGWI